MYHESKRVLLLLSHSSRSKVYNSFFMMEMSFSLLHFHTYKYTTLQKNYSPTNNYEERKKLCVELKRSIYSSIVDIFFNL